MDVLIKGFKNKEQALAFIGWYEGSGEQSAYDWLQENCPDCPVTTNMHHKGNTGRYYNIDDEKVTIFLK